MSETVPSKKPAAAPDLSTKLAQLAQQTRDTAMMIRWWQRHDDPALASLGGGIVTISSFAILTCKPPPFIANDALHVSTAVHDLVIPLEDLLDVKFMKHSAFSIAEMKAFTEGPAHG